MKSIKYSVLLLSAVALLTSCSKKKEATSSKPVKTVAVKVKSVNKENYSKYFTTSGKVEAVNSANVSTRMMGYVEAIYVKVGSKVLKGQQLLKINSADLAAKSAQVESKINEAKAALEVAEKDFNRISALYKKESVSQKQMDDITAHYNMSKARLSMAKNMKSEVNAQMAYTNIKAPFSGVITNKFVNLGALANPGMPLVSLESQGKFQVMTRVSESEIADVKLDSEVEVKIKAINEKVKGKVIEVSASGMNTAGQYEVKIILDEEPTNLFSGMFASIAFPKKHKTEESIVLIEREALIKRGQLTGVYTVSQSNTSLLRWIRLGRSYGTMVEVLSGLSFDEKYIVSSQGKLFNGAGISIQ